MKTEVKIIIGLVVLLAASIFVNYKFYFSDEGINYQHKYDSISNLQDQSVIRENALQAEVDSLESLKMAHVDSADQNTYLYQINSKAFENISVHIDTISDSLYVDYLRSRRIPKNYFN